MIEFKPPDILHLPLNYTILQLIKIGVKDIKAFPYPTLPDMRKLDETIQELLDLKLVQKIPETRNDLIITKLGDALSYIPLDPKFSIILLKTKQSMLIRKSFALWSFDHWVISDRRDF